MSKDKDKDQDQDQPERALTWAEIEAVFRSWEKQAEAAGEQPFLLWNQLLNDLRMKALR